MIGNYRSVIFLKGVDIAIFTLLMCTEKPLNINNCPAGIIEINKSLLMLWNRSFCNANLRLSLKRRIKGTVYEIFKTSDVGSDESADA